MPLECSLYNTYWVVAAYLEFMDATHHLPLKGQWADSREKCGFFLWIGMGWRELGVCSIVYTKKLLGKIRLGTGIVSYRPRRLFAAAGNLMEPVRAGLQGTVKGDSR